MKITCQKYLLLIQLIYFRDHWRECVSNAPRRAVASGHGKNTCQMPLTDFLVRGLERETVDLGQQVRFTAISRL